jgi:hypothetical protein
MWFFVLKKGNVIAAREISNLSKEFRRITGQFIFLQA